MGENGNMENIPATCVEEDEEEGRGEVAEEMLEEVMSWLELEISCPPPSLNYPYREQLSSFVTINGNEESCGPSFSDSASTVMASFDTRGASYFVGGHINGLAWPGPSSVFWPWADVFEEEKSMHVGPAGAKEVVEQNEDEWSARVLDAVTFDLDEKESDPANLVLACNL